MTEDTDATTGGEPIADASGDRIIDVDVEIDSPPEELWRALTDADALTCWFPLEAEVTPGEGGRIRMGWGDYFEGTARIEIWEPTRRLRTTWRMGSAEPEQDTDAPDAEDPDAPDVPGPRPGADDAPEDSAAPPEQEEGHPAELVVDYFIEAGSGGTRLRLVHSGFGRGADWDDWFDGTRRGWDFQLLCLRHWLERHPTRDRQVAWARRRTPLQIDRAWRRLLVDGGLAREGEILGLGVGAEYRLVTAQGDGLAGTVEVQDPPHQLAVVVRNLEDGLLRVNGETRQGATELELFLCTWAVDPGAVRSLEGRWQELLDDLLPPA